MFDRFAMTFDYNEDCRFSLVQSTLMDTPGYLLSQSGRLIRERLADALRPVGLVPQQLTILKLLSASEPMTQQAIGARCNLDKTTITELIDSLEQRGYVKRQVSPKDRRSKEVSITGSGRRVLNRALKLAQEADEQFISLMSEKEWTTVRKCLMRYLGSHTQG